MQNSKLVYLRYIGLSVIVFLGMSSLEMGVVAPEESWGIGYYILPIIVGIGVGFLIAKVSILKQANKILAEQYKSKFTNAIKESDKNRLFSEMVLNSLKSIVVITNGSKLQKANRAFTEFFGPLEDFKQIYSCISDTFIKRDGFLKNTINNLSWTNYVIKNPDELHKVIILKDHKEYYFRVNAKKIIFNNEENIIATFEDITELIEHEENLQEKINEAIEKITKKDKVIHQQTRFVAMGEMMQLISHHWKQPLSAIGLMVQDIVDAYEFGEINKEYLDTFETKAMQVIKSMSNTIDTFKYIFSQEELEMVEFSIQDAANQALSIIKPIILAKDIQLIKDFPKADVMATGYYKEYIRVLINIINNAIEVLEEKRGNKIIKISIYKNKDCKSVIEIFDNGKQIDEEVIDKIFEPYFSTKFSQNGTGLGLFISKSLIENHMNGKIEALNKDGGVSFKITI